jgi:replicative DNA helicase
MNYETLLLNKAIQDKNLAPLFDRGVSDDWFINESERRVWLFIREHHTKYAEVPSKEVISQNFPTYAFREVEDSVQFILDKVVESKRKAIIHDFMRGAISDLEEKKDYEQAVLTVQRGLIRLEDGGLSGSTDVDLTDNPEQRWDEYLERKNLPNGLRGMATGFDTIDAATSGLQKGQLIVIVAPPKTGKSTLALQMAHNIHMNGNVPLFQSFEMLNHEQASRYDAMRSRISYQRLITGTLNQEEESRYLAKLKAIGNMNHKFWLTESTSGLTVSAVANKIHMHKPDVLFLDGVYLMIDEQSGEMGTPLSLTNITRSLKRLAQTAQIPIVISTQVLKWKMTKGQVTADSIGYSSSFLQDADVLFGLQKEDEAIDDTRILKVLASRNTGPMEVSMLWDWNTGQFREITREDY